MFRNGLTGHIKPSAELAQCLPVSRMPIQELPPAFVRQRAEHGVSP